MTRLRLFAPAPVTGNARASGSDPTLVSIRVADGLESPRKSSTMMRGLYTGGMNRPTPCGRHSASVTTRASGLDASLRSVYVPAEACMSGVTRS